MSEVAGLHPSEISPSGFILKLDGNSTKGGRPRQIPLNGEAQAFFQQLRQMGERREDGYIFRDHKGLPRELQRWVNRACRELEIGHSRVYDFRAAYAQELYERLIAEGATNYRARQEAAQALGHRRIDVLRHYLK